MKNLIATDPEVSGTETQREDTKLFCVSVPLWQKKL